MKPNYTMRALLTLIYSISLFHGASQAQMLEKGPLDCNIYINSHSLFYNLGNLQSEDNYNLDIKYPTNDGEITDGDFSFNFCTQAKKPIGQCLSDLGTFGYLYHEGSCQTMTSLKTKWTYTMFENEEEKGLQAYANNTESAKTIPFDLKYTIICKNDGEAELSTRFVDNSQSEPLMRSYVELTIQDVSGCPRDFSKLIEFIDENPWVFGVLFVVFGGFMCFFGFRFLKYCLSLFGFTLGFLGSLLITLWFWNYKAASTEQIAFVVIFCLLLGLILGYIFYTFTKFAIGGAGGFLGWLVANLVFVTIEGLAQQELSIWIYLLFVAVFVAGFVVFGLYVHDICLVLATSIGGSYVLVRGLGIMFGQYPDEESLERKIRTEGLTDFPVEWWLYIGVFVVLSITGIFVQCRLIQKEKLEEDDEDDWKKDLMKDYE